MDTGTVELAYLDGAAALRAFRRLELSPLDVLDAQADVISAQILLAGAQRDVIVRSYELLSAVGRLSATQLALNVQTYDPEVHYQAVQNKWHGMKTPDGR